MKHVTGLISIVTGLAIIVAGTVTTPQVFNSVELIGIALIVIGIALMEKVD